jgi:DNA-directed RNA polymerase specialized sigma24 family protein
LPTFASEHFEFGSVLGLWDFERFVFVMAVLEQYSDHKCALLLGCSLGQVRTARVQAISRLMDQVSPILPVKVA